MNISAVYRAVEIISDSVAMLPLQVKKDNIIMENHRVYEVFKSKNIDKYLFIKMLIQSVLLKGNGFAYIERDGDGSVKSLRFLESCDVSILYNKQTNELYYQAPIIGSKRIEPCNMLHFKKNSYDGITGISVLSYANRAIKNANNTENSANNFFESGCNLSGVLKVEGQLSPQQKNDIRQSWATAYSAGGNGLAVLQGNMTYQPIQISATDALDTPLTQKMSKFSTFLVYLIMSMAMITFIVGIVHGQPWKLMFTAAIGLAVSNPARHPSAATIAMATVMSDWDVAVTPRHSSK